MDFSSSFNQWLADQTKQFNDLQNQLTAAQQASAKATADLAAANTSLSTANSRIDFLNKTVSDQAGVIADLKSQIDAFNKRPFGYNTHPLSSTIYTDKVKTSSDLRKMGAKDVRIDVVVDNTGLARSESSLLGSIAAYAPDIKPWFMVNIDEGDIKAGYAANLAIGKATATRYGWDNYEAGNEMAIKPFSDGSKALLTGDGTKLSHYDAARLAMVIQAIKGFCDGVRSVTPNAEIIVDGESSHFEFMNQVIKAGVDFDTIAWHWYVGEEKAFGGQYKIEEKLQQLFPGKKIMFNEVGYIPDSSGNVDPADFAIFTDMCKRFAKFGLFVYELYDEDNRLPGLKESRMGMLDNQRVIKPIGAAFKAAFADKMPK